MPPAWYNPIPWIMPETLWGALNYWNQQRPPQTLWDAINTPQLIPYEDALEQSWADGEYVPPPLPGYFPRGDALRNYWNTTRDSVQRTQRKVDRIRQGK